MLVQTLSVKEAAVYFRVRPKTIRHWIAAGRLEASRVGRAYLIPAAVIEQALNPSMNQINAVSESDRKAKMAKFKAAFRGGTIDKDAIRARMEEDLRLEEAMRRGCSQ